MRDVVVAYHRRGSERLDRESVNVYASPARAQLLLRRLGRRLRGLASLPIVRVAALSPLTTRLSRVWTPKDKPSTTRLFRIPWQHRALTKLLPQLADRMVRRGVSKLTVLVLGGSTGEEAVSIATTLLNEGGGHTIDFSVVSFDISPSVTVTARTRWAGKVPSDVATLRKGVPENELPDFLKDESGAIDEPAWRASCRQIVARLLPEIQKRQLLQFFEGSLTSQAARARILEADVVFLNHVIYQLPRTARRDLVGMLAEMAPGAVMMTNSTLEQLAAKPSRGLGGLGVDLSLYFEPIPSPRGALLRRRGAAD